MHLLFGESPILISSISAPALVEAKLAPVKGLPLGLVALLLPLVIVLPIGPQFIIPLALLRVT